MRADAVRHWRHLTDLDPLSGRYALGLMRALVAAGDRSGALAHARAHEQLVRHELESDPDPSIRPLVASLRAPSPPEAPPARPAASGTAPLLPPEADVPPEQETDSTTSFGAPVTAYTRRRWRTSAGRWIAALAVGLAALVVFTLRSNPSGPGATPPFLAVGSIQAPGSPDTTVSASMLRDMLSTRLGSVPGLQVVANSRLVELMHGTPAAGGAALSDAARRAGASEVIEGEIVLAGAALTMTLRRVDLGTGVVRRGYVVRAAEQFALVDSAAAAIARDLDLSVAGGAVADLRTASPVAYALYDEGLRAYYSGNWPVAYRLMTAALERDSSFAMAAYYAWRSNRGQVWDSATTLALQRAKRLASRTVDRERLLIQSAIAQTDAPVSVSLAIAETLSVRYPADPDAFITLGLARFEAGDFPGSIAGFERAFALDSVAGAFETPYCRVCEALVGITNDYLWWDSAVAAEGTARRLIAILPDNSSGWGNLVEPLLRLGRRTEAEAAVERAAALDPAGLSVRSILNRDLIRAGRFDDLERELFTDLRSPSPGARNVGRWLLLLSLRSQGRLREAEALAREGLLPGSARPDEGIPPEPTMLAILALERGDARDAALRFRELAGSTMAANVPAGFKARVTAWQLTLAGTALAEAGDTASVRLLAGTVERVGRDSNFGRDSRLHHYLRGLILQRAGHHEGAVRAFEQAVFSLTDGYTRINLSLARSHLALGRVAEAIAVLQSALRGGVDGSNTYVTHTELHEALARAFERAGNADSAAAHYRRVEAAWQGADPTFRDRYERARAGARLRH
jgi:tetratricopeptide (TPR) repeat protein